MSGRLKALPFALATLALAGRAVLACATDDPASGLVLASDDDAGTPTKKDASVEEPTEDATPPQTKDGGAKDSGPYQKDCPGTTAQTRAGETCVGFGDDAKCASACGRPYGFVCFDGGPPAFTDCARVSSTFLGDTYCCTENKCVLQPDRGGDCAGVAGKPNRYQCPPGTDGGPVTASAGCVEKGSGGSKLERFYCCP